MFQKIMIGPFGEAFLRDVRKAKRSIFLWTVNDEEIFGSLQEVSGREDPFPFPILDVSYFHEHVDALSHGPRGVQDKIWNTT
jgi:hypothetical protein